MRRVRLLAATGAATAIGCAPSRSAPGDYAGGARAGEDGGAVAVADGGEAPRAEDAAARDQAAPSADAQHLLVLAGERDGAEPATSELWVGAIGAAGAVGSFQPLQPGLFRGPILAATVAEGRLLAAMRGPGRFVEHIAFDAGIAGSWSGAAAPAPDALDYATVFAGARLLALGGAKRAYDGSLVPTRDIWGARFDVDAGAFGPLAEISTKLPVPMRRTRPVTYKDFVYVVGGENNPFEEANKVYVARVDGGELGAFASATSIVSPATGRPHAPSNPILCAVEAAPGRGRLIVAGGEGTDVVLTSAIDEATGALGPWQASPSLPEPLEDAACEVWGGHLHILGGRAAAGRTDRILRAPLGAEGEPGAWDPASDERLPAPRSSIFARVY